MGSYGGLGVRVTMVDWACVKLWWTVRACNYGGLGV